MERCDCELILNDDLGVLICRFCYDIYNMETLFSMLATKKKFTEIGTILQKLYEKMRMAKYMEEDKLLNYISDENNFDTFVRNMNLMNYIPVLKIWCVASKYWSVEQKEDNKLHNLFSDTGCIINELEQKTAEKIIQCFLLHIMNEEISCLEKITDIKQRDVSITNFIENMQWILSNSLTQEWGFNTVERLFQEKKIICLANIWKNEDEDEARKKKEEIEKKGLKDKTIWVPVADPETEIVDPEKKIEPNVCQICMYALMAVEFDEESDEESDDNTESRSDNEPNFTTHLLFECLNCSCRVHGECIDGSPYVNKCLHTWCN